MKKVFVYVGKNAVITNISHCKHMIQSRVVIFTLVLLIRLVENWPFTKKLLFVQYKCLLR